VTALTYLSVIQGIYGRLHAAADLCRQVIQLAGQSPLAASAYIGLGTLLYEWNDLESADQNLQLGIGLSQHSGDLSIKSYGYRSLATLQQARGESVAAVNTLQKVHQIGSDDQVSPVTRLRNAACHVQLALAQNDLATAEFWNRQVIEPAHTSPFYIRLGLIPARLFLAQNKKAEARARLEALAEVANQVGLVSDLVEVRTLQALAAAAPVEALNFLVEALQIAQPEGFVRTFVDKGEPMKLLLERLRSQGSAYQAYVLSLLAGFKETGSTPLPPQVADLLSERELEVLRLVAEGMSNRDVAEQLVVTVGTVKTHIHRILDKLGVRSRLQAVAKARELGLL
jgi:LuxR family maltose regulon positive regulatory protein